MMKGKEQVILFFVAVLKIASNQERAHRSLRYVLDAKALSLPT